MSWSLNIWDVFETNQVQMRQSAIGRCRVGGGLKLLLGLWLISGVCSLGVLGSCMSHSLLVPVHMYDSETMI